MELRDEINAAHGEVSALEFRVMDLKAMIAKSKRDKCGMTFSQNLAQDIKIAVLELSLAETRFRLHDSEERLEDLKDKETDQ